MLSEKFNNAIKILYDIYKDSNIDWIIIGSVNHCLHGMDKNPEDIDIIVPSKEQVQKTESLFKSYLTVPAHFIDHKEYTAYKLLLDIDSVPIHILGEYRSKDGQDIWGELSGFGEKTEMFYEGMCLPTLSLRQEYSAYSNTGRKDKALDIMNHIAKQITKVMEQIF